MNALLIGIWLGFGLGCAFAVYVPDCTRCLFAGLRTPKGGRA
jgi:hypothetical protein